MIQKTFAYLFILLSTVVETDVLQAQIRLPSLVSDSMVLQRDQPIRLWGWALAGEEVRVLFGGKKYTTKTGDEGKWTLTLPPMAAGGPYNMTIRGSNTIRLKHILLGDVWLCSGQSNMEFPMKQARERYAKEIASSENPAIRQFRITERKYSFTPLPDLKGKWSAADPNSVLDFTAAGYFFALGLYNKYKVPIGLINASWGGTPIEAWLSEEGLKRFPAYVSRADQLKDTAVVRDLLKKDQDRTDNWLLTAKTNDKGFSTDGSSWADAADTTAWKKIVFPGSWNDQGEKGLNGVVWIKRTVFIPSPAAGKDARLRLGTISDIDTTYFNGVKVGSNPSSYFNRDYRVPAALIRAGINTIVIRIVNKSGNGGLVRGKTYQLDIGDKVFDLKGEWHYRIGVSMPPIPGTTVLWYQPTAMFNGLIAPLIPYSLKGVIWYQGESNVSHAMEYRRLLPDMIDDWRSGWNRPELPFLIVQLPCFTPPKAMPGKSDWALLRESQAITAATTPGCGITVNIDTGDPYDIHPTDKKSIGDRLALLAEKMAYDEADGVYTGPVYKSMEQTGNAITLSFSNTGSGLIARGDTTLHQFAIAGEDRIFFWAHARIEGDKVVVSSDKVPHPVAVRYAWSDNPEGCNLYNKEVLPAMPFRTDNWTD